MEIHPLLAIICPNSTIETLDQGVKYAQSMQSKD